MWQDLAATLNELNKIYRQLVELGKQKRSALVTIDMKTLERLLKDEDDLTKKIKELEQQRQKALINLAVKNRAIKKDSKLTDLLQYAPNAQLRQILEQLHGELSQNTAAAKELSEGNSLLIRGAMQAVAYHLNRIGGTTVEPTYGQGGGEVVSHRQNYEFDA
ncbi:FlgN protein [Selenomonas sp. GACV-9]|uniref:flagellar protein FlgN n=1 Tax=Selenomonas sp. GACV-9 TaxID=3158782 RepID=UPI0008F0462E|nr:FlgN protein [Selenomonas ruminantium]